jgi:hypothetical protein
MKRLAGFLVAAATVATSMIGSARADITYQWTTTSATGALAADYSALAPELVITDVAEASGSASVDAPCSLLPGPPCGFTDNGIVSFFSDILPPGQGFGTLLVDVTTNPDGTLSGSITEQGQDEDFIASGSEYSWTVTEVVGDEGYIQNCRSCTATGYFQAPIVATSEPTTTALLVPAVGIVVLWRCRRSA